MKISIVTACFNSESTLEDAIKSVLSQDYEGIEYIIVDGASTDNTMDIVNRYRERVCTIISEPDKGIYDALNKGITAATGDFIGFVHSDDMLASNSVISDLVQAINADPQVDAVYGDLNYVKASDVSSISRRWVSKPFKSEMLGVGWMPAHPSLYLRKQFYENYGLFNLRYRISADYDSVLRFFSQSGFSAIYLPKVMVNMRVGGASNGSFRAIFLKTKEDYQALKLNGIKKPLLALILKNVSKVSQFF